MKLFWVEKSRSQLPAIFDSKPKEPRLTQGLEPLGGLTSSTENVRLEPTTVPVNLTNWSWITRTRISVDSPAALAILTVLSTPIMTSIIVVIIKNLSLDNRGDILVIIIKCKYFFVVIAGFVVIIIININGTKSIYLIHGGNTNLADYW